MRAGPARAGAILAACLLCLTGAVALGAARHRAPKHHAARRACRHTAHKRCKTPHRAKRKTSSRAHVPAPQPSGAAPGATATTGAGAGAEPPPGSPPPGPGETPQPNPEAPAGPARLQVSAKEFSFTLSRPSAQAGKIVVELLDAGQDEHNLHIRPAAGGADVASFPTTLPGRHVDEQFDLAPGTYTLYCGIPAHEELGMKATFTVR